jgi:hypothetical protein
MQKRTLSDILSEKEERVVIVDIQSKKHSKLYDKMGWKKSYPPLPYEHNGVILVNKVEFKKLGA